MARDAREVEVGDVVLYRPGEVFRREAALARSGRANPVGVGGLLPLLVTKSWGDGSIGGKVYIDGDTSEIVLDVGYGVGVGEWRWYS